MASSKVRADLVRLISVSLKCMNINLVFLTLETMWRKHIWALLQRLQGVIMRICLFLLWRKVQFPNVTVRLVKLKRLDLTVKPDPSPLMWSAPSLNKVLWSIILQISKTSPELPATLYKMGLFMLLCQVSLIMLSFFSLYPGCNYCNYVKLHLNASTLCWNCDSEVNCEFSKSKCYNFNSKISCRFKIFFHFQTFAML